MADAFCAGQDHDGLCRLQSEPRHRPHRGRGVRAVRRASDRGVVEFWFENMKAFDECYGTPAFKRTVRTELSSSTTSRHTWLRRSYRNGAGLVELYGGVPDEGRRHAGYFERYKGNLRSERCPRSLNPTFLQMRRIVARAPSDPLRATRSSRAFSGEDEIWWQLKRKKPRWPGRCSRGALEICWSGSTTGCTGILQRSFPQISSLPTILSSAFCSASWSLERAFSSDLSAASLSAHTPTSTEESKH